MKWLWRVLAVGLTVFLVAVAGFLVWALWTPAPMPAAMAALESDEQVQVTTGDWLVFTPMTQPVTSGFIFYPGGRVDGRSYAPAARLIATAGHLVVIPSMPLNLAVFAPNRAAEVQAAYPAITDWAIGGHSLGGAMAASFVFGQAGAVDTLVLWASYPAQNQSLADRTDLTVTSIYGTLDGLATVDQIEQSRPLLPLDTTFVPIEGGNHAQFGWYGDQRGDNPATISRAEQQEQAVNATLTALGTSP